MESLIRNALLAVVALVGALIVPSCLADGKHEPSIVLITARPSSIKLIRLADATDGGFSPAYFEAELTEVKVLSGGGERFPRKIRAQIRATDSYALMRYDRIFLVVEKDHEGGTHVLHWSEVVSMACAPREVVSSNESLEFFDSPWGGDKVCMFIRGR